MIEEKIERTPITIHISEEDIIRAIEVLKADKRDIYERMNPKTRKLLDAVERSKRLTARDYGIIVY